MNAARWAAWLLLFGTLSSPLHVRAQEVLVFGDLRPGLCGALRIQLGPDALSCTAALTAESFQARLAAAVDAVREGGATLGVWVEGEPDGLRLYIVGDRPGAALIAAESLEARDGPSVDRSLALKVREALDVTARVREEPAPLPAVLVDASRTRTFLWVEGGGALLWSAAPLQGAARVALGVRLRRARLELSPSLGLSAPTPLRFSGVSGDVQISELSPVADLRGGYSRGAWVVGGLVGVRLRVLRATGSRDDGASGKATSLVTATRVGLHVRRRVLRWLWVDCALGVELSAHRRRFALSDEVVADLGLARGFAQLAWVASGF